MKDWMTPDDTGMGEKVERLKIEIVNPVVNRSQVES
jgi:hypothetical protein